MQEAERLIQSGYRTLSNKFRMIARLDLADWKEVMATDHSPGDVAEGMKWANGLGDGAADHYRGRYSTDTLINVPQELYDAVKHAPGASHGWGNLNEYLPLIPPEEGAPEYERWQPRVVAPRAARVKK